MSSVNLISTPVTDSTAPPLPSPPLYDPFLDREICTTTKTQQNTKIYRLSYFVKPCSIRGFILDPLGTSYKVRTCLRTIKLPQKTDNNTLKKNTNLTNTCRDLTPTPSPTAYYCATPFEISRSANEHYVV